MRLLNHLFVVSLLLSIPYTYCADKAYERSQDPGLADFIKTGWQTESFGVKDREISPRLRLTHTQCNFGLDTMLFTTSMVESPKQTVHEVKGLSLKCNGKYSFKESAESGQDTPQSDYSVNVDNVDFKVVLTSQGQEYGSEKYVFVTSSPGVPAFSFSGNLGNKAGAELSELDNSEFLTSIEEIINQKISDIYFKYSTKNATNKKQAHMLAQVDNSSKNHVKSKYDDDLLAQDDDDLLAEDDDDLLAQDDDDLAQYDDDLAQDDDDLAQYDDDLAQDDDDLAQDDDDLAQYDDDLLLAEDGDDISQDDYGYLLSQLEGDDDDLAEGDDDDLAQGDDDDLAESSGHQKCSAGHCTLAESKGKEDVLDKLIDRELNMNAETKSSSQGYGHLRNRDQGQVQGKGQQPPPWRFGVYGGPRRFRRFRPYGPPPPPFYPPPPPFYRRY